MAIPSSPYSDDNTRVVQRPNLGVFQILASNSIFGRTARRLLPVALIAPLILGATTILAIRTHTGYGLFLTFLIVVSSIVLLTSIIWSNILTLMDQVERAKAMQIQLADADRKKISDVLEAAQDHLSDVLEDASLGSWHWDLKTDQRTWSDQCKRMFGLPLDTEMSLTTLRESIHPEDRPRLDEARKNSINNSVDYFIEYRVVWPDASVRWIESRGRAYRDESGQPLRFEGISQDVSERHFIEERQRQFLKDMLAGVTNAKLILCLNKNELPVLLDPATEPIEITVANGGIRVVRDAAYEACLKADYPLERCYDMKTAAAEAAMNSAAHAETGFGQVFVGENRTVQVKVTDRGKGIALANLPSATLKKGYTTAGTFGHGLKMMLQAADRVFLLTGSSGTTVIIEMDIESTEVFW